MRRWREGAQVVCANEIVCQNEDVGFLDGRAFFFVIHPNLVILDDTFGELIRSDVGDMLEVMRQGAILGTVTCSDRRENS